MPASRKKPPRRNHAERETPLEPSAALVDSIACAYATAIARAILAAADALDTTGCGTTRRSLVNHLRGNQLPRAPGERPESGFGILEAHGARWIEEIIDRLDEAGFLTTVVLPRGGVIVSLSHDGKAALEGTSIPASVLPPRPRLGDHPEAEGRLRELRRRIAAEEGRPTFSIFPNSVLATLAARRPESLAELAEVPGLGAPRIRKYGRRILAALRKA